MPTSHERVFAADSASEITVSERYPKSKHPKRELYKGAYDETTDNWFSVLFTPENLERLEKETQGMNTLEMLEHYNAFFHVVVDEIFDRAEYQEQITRAVGTVSLHKKYVAWQGHKVPDAEASSDEVEESFRYKMKRNISLALLEALALLESGILRIIQDPSVSGEIDLAASMQHSHELIMRFGRIHGDHALVRLQKFTNAAEITYPEIRIAEILEGRNIIAAHHMKLIPHETPGIVSVDFVYTPQRWHKETLADTDYAGITASPTAVCPAERLNPSPETRDALQPYIQNHEEADGSWNRYFWELLIDIYARSKRFEEYQKNFTN
jgi:hypothetical protein